MTNTLFEEHLDRLTSVARRLASAFEAGGIQYRVIGGYAVYMHVNAIDPIAARLTRDLDVAVQREDVARIRSAVEPFGFVFRHVAGVDMLLDAAEPKGRSAVHLVFVREKVHPEYIEAVPEFSNPVRSGEGLLIAPVSDLVRMKLTSFRLKDKVHIQDLDHAGLITPEIEASLSEVLRARLAEVRATE